MHAKHCLWASLLLAWAVGAQARTWTDRAGQSHLEAEMVGTSAGKVWLQLDNDLLLLPVTDFSPADQDYVRQHAKEVAPPPATAAPVKPFRYKPGRELCKLANQTIKESSGIACSRRTAGIFWTHNDSGYDARLYAFDKTGRDRGSCLLAGTVAFDWEDICSFTRNGKSYLLVGDIGNNGRNAGVQILYLIEEPVADPQRGVLAREVPVLQVINYAYPDDYHDCEALGLDPTSNTILLITKERRMACNVYALPWPENNPKKLFVPRLIATLKLPKVTAMDVTPDGHHAVVLTYGDAFEFTRGDGEDWAKAFSRRPSLIPLPPLRQGEGICYGPDGKTLYLTSEQLPTPLVEVEAE
jgi:hypothetical protein